MADEMEDINPWMFQVNLREVIAVKVIRIAKGTKVKTNILLEGKHSKKNQNSAIARTQESIFSSKTSCIILYLQKLREW